jgi:hypothetical protein
MKRPWMALAAAGLLAVGEPTGAMAQTIHRCVDARGHVSLQSQPCGPGQSESRAVHYEPIVDSPAAAARLRRIEQDMEARRRAASMSGSSNWSAGGTTATSDNGCETAKRHRAAILEQVGLRRTYDLLQKLDETVREACKAR